MTVFIGQILIVVLPLISSLSINPIILLSDDTARLSPKTRYISSGILPLHSRLLISQISSNVKSAVSYGHSDNDGSFTVGFSIGEIFRYATLKKELGDYAPETLKARESATRACEACLLLMYIAGRGNGFVARSYLTTAEPIPDDGLFYKKNGEQLTHVEYMKIKSIKIEINQNKSWYQYVKNYIYRNNPWLFSTSY